jgi:hypothetical protein
LALLLLPFVVVIVINPFFLFEEETAREGARQPPKAVAVAEHLIVVVVAMINIRNYESQFLSLSISISEALSISLVKEYLLYPTFVINLGFLQNFQKKPEKKTRTSALLRSHTHARAHNAFGGRRRRAKRKVFLW